MTLYLKYRPQTIDDLDLKSVRDSLQKTLSKDEIPHAFLFAGPRGTGKTSAARIVAKALNCQAIKKSSVSIEPCNQCSSCISITRGENLDVIEIDAASHRGIDDIRVLRDAVKLAPIASSKKIYIIDEAHMLTTEACNALLKILEEPPQHVVFILATTNPEKLIDTIRSRTTLIPFTKATEEDVVRRLVKVAEGEKVAVDTAVLKLIAHCADGAFRDAVKLFEQIISEDIKLTEESVSEFLFGSKSFDPKAFLETLIAKDSSKALDTIEHGIQNGVSAKTMAKGILDILRAKLLGEIPNGETLGLIELFSKAYTEIPQAYLEQLPLEIAVVKWCTKNYESRITNQEKEQKIKPPDSSPKVESAPAEEKHEARKTKNETEKEKLTKDADTVIPAGIFSDETWTKVLSEVRPKNAATEALLRACKPTSFDGKILHIAVYYKFHKERLEAHPHRDLLEETLAACLGSTIRIQCTLTDPPAKKLQEEVTINHEVVLTEAKNDDTILKAAKDIFGN